MIRKTVIAIALAAAAAVPALAHAQAIAAPASPHTVAGNMAIVSDYRFRGISQTYVQPAIQGGVDYSHSSGFYLGNWNSSVSGLSYANGAGIEMDIYGGYKKGFGDFTFDLGLLQYYYPKAQVAGTKYDTLEGYFGLSWKWLTAKYSITTTDWFGVANSDGSGYLDVTASYEIKPKLTLVGHFGKQTVNNSGNLSYTDYKIGMTYDMNGWVLGAAYIDTDADDPFYTVAGKELGKSTVVLSVSKSF